MHMDTYVDINVFCIIVVALLGTPLPLLLRRHFILAINLLKRNLALDSTLRCDDCTNRRFTASSIQVAV